MTNPKSRRLLAEALDIRGCFFASQAHGRRTETANAQAKRCFALANYVRECNNINVKRIEDVLNRFA